MNRLLSLLGAGILAGTLVSAPATPHEAELALPRLESGKAQLVLVRPDGTTVRRLSHTAANDTDPCWSPDGKRLLFTSDRDGKQSIYVMDADGRNLDRLTDENVRDRAAVWSPDGKKIAFIRHVDDSPFGQIFVMNADGSDPTNVTHSAQYDADPTWSPDGKKIAFTSTRGGDGFRVYIMGADGQNVREVTRVGSPNGYVYPAWSPDGRWIAHAAPVGKDLELFVVSPDGKERKQLTRLGGVNSLAAWSPDGKKIAFLHARAGTNQSEVYVMDADGSHPKPVPGLEVPTEGGRPAWRP